MLQAWLQENDLLIKKINFYFQRTRSNGLIGEYDERIWCNAQLSKVKNLLQDKIKEKMAGSKSLEQGEKSDMDKKII